MSDSDSSDRGAGAPAGEGAPEEAAEEATGRAGPSAEELLILLGAASRLPPDKMQILLKAIWEAIEH